MTSVTHDGPRPARRCLAWSLQLTISSRFNVPHLHSKSPSCFANRILVRRAQRTDRRHLEHAIPKLGYCCVLSSQGNLWLLLSSSTYRSALLQVGRLRIRHPENGRDDSLSLGTVRRRHLWSSNSAAPLILPSNPGSSSQVRNKVAPPIKRCCRTAKYLHTTVCQRAVSPPCLQNLS